MCPSFSATLNPEPGVARLNRGSGVRREIARSGEAVRRCAVDAIGRLAPSRETRHLLSYMR